jgi:hypothetical protein
MTEHRKADRSATPDPPIESSSEEHPMPQPVYPTRPFYVQWCPSDTGGGNHSVRDSRDGSYVYSYDDVPDMMAWTHYAAQAYAATRNLEYAERCHREAIERLHTNYLERIKTAAEILGDQP